MSEDFNVTQLPPDLVAEGQLPMAPSALAQLQEPVAQAQQPQALDQPPDQGTPSRGEMMQQPAQPPPRVPGTSSLGSYQGTKGQIFRNMLGNFLYSTSKGLAAAGHGPEANYRGAGAAISAIPDRQLQDQQLAMQQQQIASEAALRQAQASQYANTIMTPYGPMNAILASKVWPAGLRADATKEAAQTAADTNIKTTEMRIDSAEKQTAEKLVSAKELSADKLKMMQEVLANKKDYQDASLKLRQAGFGLRVQKLAQDQEALSTSAQNVLMQSSPALDQMEEILRQFEPLKNDNTPFKYTKERAKYAIGIHSDIGTAADTIAQLELNKVTGAARVIKGSSRSIQALQKAMQHLPNVWVDSPQQIYSKAENLVHALKQIEDDAYKYGKKSGIVPPQQKTETPTQEGVPKGWVLKAGPKGYGYYPPGK